ncbi:MAG: hypothetical protein ACXV8L_05070 [Ilumatobacteraceae bacterium]
MVDVKVDFKDVWSAVGDVAHELTGEGTVQLASNGFALPRGVSSPDQLTGWSDAYAHVREGMVWKSQWFILLTTPTRIRLGATWYYGGGVEGKGRYIANANVYFIIDSIGWWEKFKVESHFDQPLIVGNGVAQLSGSINVSYYEESSLSQTLHAELLMHGDSYGRLNWIW